MSRNLAQVSFRNWSITLRLYEDSTAPWWFIGYRRLAYGGNAPWWKNRYAFDFWRFAILFEYYA